MNSKERVLTALDHKEPDRVPFYLFYTPEVCRDVSKAMGIDIKDDPYLFDIELDNDLLMTYRGISNIPGILHGEVTVKKGKVFYDQWKIGYKRIDYGKGKGKGAYIEMVEHPLSDKKKYDSYKFPDPLKENYSEHKKLVDRYGKDYGIIAAAPATTFEAAWYLRGFDNFFMDLTLDPDFAVDLMYKTANYHLAIFRKMINIGADIAWVGDDMGMQEGMMMSPEQFRKLIKPVYAYIIQEIKKMDKNVQVAYHSDGFIEPIIPDFIEIGLDILEAIQPSCMNPGELKKKYGKNLSFWGGVDVQHVMPFGTPEEVISEIKERIRTVAPGGGFIFCTAHCVQPSERAVGNIFTYYWAAKKYGNYPIRL